ncbi:MAG: RNA polymerase factor sigma-54 [Pyrinomonadaceae bacterium]|nr:RNA polymerase factor sigma-54 [Phycisphaerales bacterium]
MKFSQQMKLAPRMIQSMEILQMSLLQLEERIAQELESNATLELREPGMDAGGDPIGGDLDGGGSSGGLNGESDSVFDGDRERPMQVDEGSSRDDFERLDSFESAQPEAAENAFDDSDRPVASNDTPHREEYSPDYVSSSSGDGVDAKSEAMANTAAGNASLVEQLREQWGLVDIVPDLKDLGELIISNIEDDGYLRTPLTAIVDNAPARPDGAGPSVEDLERALQAVQLLLEPPGVAARDVKECLLLQLDALEAGEVARFQDLSWGGPQSAEWKIVRRLVEDHLDDLSQNRLPKIAEKTGLSLTEIKKAIEHMRYLSLAPGRQLVNDSAPTIIPDAIIEYDADRDRYVAYLNDTRLPNLRVNQEYASLARDRTAPKQTREFLKKNLSNAAWLIDAVEQRRRTLLRVINAILDAQRDYFDYGPQALRPLPMTLVAEQLGIHVATVSRAVADKYVMTPRGVVPLRGFFTGGTQNESGEDVSWDAVKSALKEVIESEDKSKPFSDDDLADEVKKRGVEIARRTVAKYRSQLGIPSARLRKTF